MTDLADGPSPIRHPLVADGAPLYTRLRAVVDAGVNRLPLHGLLGAQIVEILPGRCTFTQRVDSRVLDDAGRLIPGTLFVAADGALGSAIGTCVPASLSMTTLELSVEFVRLGRPSADQLTVWAGLNQVSELSALASGEITAGGEAIARISTRCALIPRPPSAPVPTPPDQPGFPAQPDGPGTDDWRAHLRPRLQSVSADGATVTGVADRGLVNSRGDTQGGVLGLLAEQAITAALDVAAPVVGGGPPDAATFDVTFVRPSVGNDAVLTATSTVEHAGRRFAVARAVVTDPRGRPLVLARGTRLR